MGDFYKCGKCGTIVKVVYKGEGTLSCCGEPMEKLSGFGSVDEILSFAIEKEQEAHDFYHDLASKAGKRWVQDLLESFAKEELGHKQKLVGVRDGRLLVPSPKQASSKGRSSSSWAVSVTTTCTATAGRRQWSFSALCSPPKTCSPIQAPRSHSCASSGWMGSW